ncbi:MAG: MFS transporter, partial [Acetobacteraceae bacterium]
MPESPPLPDVAAPRHAELRVGLAVCAVGLATTIPLPLYGQYAARGGYGAGALAMAFACYAATVIVSAPLLGPLPDRIGRKPCVLLGVALAMLSTLLLAIFPSIPALAVARVAQGLGMLGKIASSRVESIASATPSSTQGFRPIRSGRGPSSGA